MNIANEEYDPRNNPSLFIENMAQQTLDRLAEIYASDAQKIHAETLKSICNSRYISISKVKAQLNLVNQSLCGLTIKKKNVYNRNFVAYKAIWLVYKTFIKEQEEPNQYYGNLSFNPSQLKTYLTCELDTNTFIPDNVVKLKSLKNDKDDLFSHEIYYG